MVICSREKVARLREQYPAGTRICLNSMDGEAGMPKGLVLQRLLGLGVLGGNHEARGVHVKAVHDARPVVSLKASQA